MHRRALLRFILLSTLAGALSMSTAALSQEPKAKPPASGGIGILEAARSTLERHPLLQLQQKQVDVSRALLRQAVGDFDLQLGWAAEHKRINSPLTDSERLLALQTGFDTDHQSTNLTTITGDAQRLLRSGIAIGPRVEMNRTTDNLESREGVSRTRLSFEMNIPLMRGKGREFVTAHETTSQIGVDASLLDLNQTAADLVLATAASYWQYVALLTQLEIITGSEGRGKEFVDSVQTLIQADRIPRSEIHQVQANLAGRSAGRISLEQQAAVARHQLALAMGLGPDQLADLLVPADSFPDGEYQTPPSISPDRIRFYIDEALKHRADFLAIEKRRQVAELLRKSAGNKLQPRLDLALSSGYSGLQEGRRPDEVLVSPFTRAHGPDFLFGLRYSFSPANNLASGQLAEAEASYQQVVLLSAEKARNIGAQVASAATSVFNGVARLKIAREAVTAFQAALGGEKDKLRLGVGSLTDLLTVEGRLTEALLDLVDAQQAYAIALAQFRYASGTLTASGSSGPSVEREVFLNPPF
jgi:outer membrane protein